MNDEQKLKYLMSEKWRFTVDSFLSIPVAILLYWLNYKTAFVLFLAVEILGTYIVQDRIKKIEIELGIYR